MKQPPPDQLLQACGVDSPLQFEVEQTSSGETVRRTLAFPFGLIGRDERVDLLLSNRKVSRRHAYLHVVAGRVWCLDLGSRTGTHWSKERRAIGPVDLHQRIHIGPYSLRLVAGGGADVSGTKLLNPCTVASYDPASLPSVSLEFLSGTTRPTLGLLNRVLTLVGNSPSCKIRLACPTVSAYHCALWYAAGSVWVTDLRGRGGTHVNGTPVRWAQLESGDELQLGQFRIQVRYVSGHLLPYQTERREDAPTALQAKSKEVSVRRVSRPTALAPALEAAPAALLPAERSPGSDVAVGKELVESMLLPLVAQFSMMQQQMLDQFQQSLMMLTSTFRGLHREQMDLIRLELSQLHEVTRELQGLWMEQAKETLGTDAKRTSTAGEAKSSLPLPLETRREGPPLSPKVAGTPSAGFSRETPAAGRDVDATAKNSVPERPGSEIHGWLSERIAALQEERKTRWQKILTTLLGE